MKRSRSWIHVAAGITMSLLLAFAFTDTVCGAPKTKKKNTSRQVRKKRQPEKKFVQPAKKSPAKQTAAKQQTSLKNPAAELAEKKADTSCTWPSPTRAKILYHGWGMPPLDQWVKNVEQMEEEAPFDGMSFYLGDISNPFVNRKVSYEKCIADIQKFKSIKFKKYTDNFLMTLIDQIKPNWFDEAEWENVAFNWGIAAKVAKEAGMVGVMFDPEGYGTYPVNNYWTSKFYLKTDETERTMADYKKIARKRGHQIGEAMFKEFPNMTFLSFYFYSFGGDLMAEMVNGILEKVTPNAVVADGDEWIGYKTSGKGGYNWLANRNKSVFGYADEKLKEAGVYEKHFTLAPSMYIDAYFQPDMIGGIGEDNRPNMFFKNLLYAADVSGGYVWVYGEQGQWWKKNYLSSKQKMPEHWDKQIPQISKAVSFVTRFNEYPLPQNKNLLNGGEWKFQQEESEETEGQEETESAEAQSGEETPAQKDAEKEKKQEASGEWRKNAGMIKGGANAEFFQYVKNISGYNPIFIRVKVRLPKKVKEGKVYLALDPINSSGELSSADSFVREITPKAGKVETFSFLYHPNYPLEGVFLHLQCKGFQPEEECYFFQPELHYIDFTPPSEK